MPLRAALPTILVLSGAAALLHETAWFRLLAPVVGVGAIPAAVVAAGALLGMAAGAALGGRLADRAARPARLLAAAEGAGALLGLLVPALLPRLSGLPPGPALAAATLGLAAAAIPWGATLPAALRVLGAEGPAAGRAFRGLYAWNTAGALLGIAAGAAWLLEALGNRGTVALASGIQALAAVAALGIRAGPAPVPAAAAPAAPPAAPPALLLAAAFAGAAAVAAQVAWMRRLTPLLGATFPVFAAVLAVHVGGIALGTALLGPRRGERPAGRLLLLAGVAAAATAGMPLLLAPVVEAVRPTWWDAFGDPLAMLGMRAAVTAALALPGVLAGAALLPWLVRAAEPAAEAAGRGSGGLLAANAAGAAAGGIGSALVLVPAAGSAGALAVSGAAYLAAGACLAAGRSRAALAIGGGALAILAVARPPADAAAVEAVGALYSPEAWAPEETLTLLHSHGRNGQVLVRDREGILEFWIDGSLEASNVPTDRLHLGLLGHLPLVLFEARTDRRPRVALVGLGAGYTAQAAAAHRPESLVVYELEPEVVRAAERFRGIGGGLPPGASVVLGDGRRAVLAGEGTLDVLSSDPVHPGQAGSAFLYSAEYYRGAVARLSPEGILVQWLPLYQLHEEEFRLALRTFAASVPHPYAFLAGRDLLLVASRTPLRLPLERLARALEGEGAAALRVDGIGTPGRILALLALDPGGCRAAGGEGPLNTDDRLLLELRAGWREGDGEAAAQAVLADLRADPRVLLDAPPDDAFEADLRRGVVFRLALATWLGGSLARSEARLSALCRDDPGHGLARLLLDEARAERARELLDRGDREGAARLAREIAARPGAAPIRRLDAAAILADAGFPDEARAIAAPYAATTPWPRAKRLAEGR
jgi:spermidine synthase